MLRNITANKINDLIKIKSGFPSITMYMPTHKSGAPHHVTEDITRFKNMSSEVIKKLEDIDKHSKVVNYFKQTSNKLLEDRDFWSSTGKSVLFCIKQDMFEHYNLPIDSDEYISIDDNFHLAPVAGIIDELQNFYVLNLSMKYPKLYQGDISDIKKLDIGLPSTLEDALSIDEMHLSSLQFSSIDGPKGATYHGHGAGKDTGTDEKVKYFKIIDHIINENTTSDLPLIIAGNPAELSVFRDVCTYSKLLKSQINQNYSEHELDMLHSKANDIIYTELVSSAHQKLLVKLNELQNAPGLVSEKLKNIKDAAASGRVHSLLLNMRHMTKDNVRDGIFNVQKLKFGDKAKVLDSISREVIAHGGQVLNLPNDKMPNGEMVIALNRY